MMGKVRMRTVFKILVLFAIVNLACSNSDTAVTHTGNPVKANLSYSIDTTGNYTRSIRGDSLVSAITITTAKIVVNEVKLKAENDWDSLIFRSEIPFILDLNLNGGAKLLDSTITTAGVVFDRFRFKVDQLSSEHGSLFTENPDLQNRSLLVKGYVDNDTSLTFTFPSDLSETLEIEFDDAITIPDASEIELQLKFNILKWFSDGEGGLLDPRIDNNKSDIEGNFKKSIKLILDI